MTVIRFPVKNSKSAAPATTFNDSSVSQAIVQRHWSDMDFPPDGFRDSCGLLDFHDNGHSVLSAFFSRFGLQLPRQASAEATHTLWKELTFRYGRGVRVLDSVLADDFAKRCDDMTFAEQQYCLVVAQGATESARKLACRVFSSAAFRPFLVPLAT